jgi:hypothetical protein
MKKVLYLIRIQAFVLKLCGPTWADELHDCQLSTVGFRFELEMLNVISNITLTIDPPAGGPN